MARVATYIAAMTFLARALATADSLYTTAYSNCADASDFTISAFNASLTPTNKTFAYTLDGESSYSGNSSVVIEFSANGSVATEAFDPCIVGIASLCPASPGPVTVAYNAQVPAQVASAFSPSVLTSSALDAQVRVRLHGGDGRDFACVEANFTNGVAQQGNESQSGSGGEDNDGPPSSASATSSNWVTLM